MTVLLLLLSALALFIVAILVYKKQKKPKRIMQEGRLVKSETVYVGGEQLYVEKVAFKDWHVCIHAFVPIEEFDNMAQPLI